MHLEFYLKVQLKIFLFFNKKEIFTIEKSILIENVYNYWVKKENGENINKRFIRQELFALKNNFK